VGVDDGSNVDSHTYPDEHTGTHGYTFPRNSDSLTTHK